MHGVILITGQVKFRINLDPSIWIIDDRHFQLSERLEGVEGLAMEFAPYLKKAEPDPAATHLLCHRSEGEDISITMEEAMSAYLCFAKEGKPIREGGPALLYLADGSNRDHPISHITQLEVIVRS